MKRANIKNIMTVLAILIIAHNTIGMEKGKPQSWYEWVFGKPIDKKALEQEFVESARNGDIKRVKEIIKQNINVNAQNNHGDTALTLAASYNHPNIAKLLLDRSDTNVNVQANDDFTALMGSALKGHAHIAKLLLDKPGINVNTQDKQGYTALIWAARLGRTDIAKDLLTMPGIKVNIESNNGQTALIWAARDGHTDIIKHLLAHQDTTTLPTRQEIRSLKKEKEGYFQLLPSEVVNLASEYGAPYSISTDEAKKVMERTDVTEEMKNVIQQEIDKRGKK